LLQKVFLSGFKNECSLLSPVALIYACVSGEMQHWFLSLSTTDLWANDNSASHRRWRHPGQATYTCMPLSSSSIIWYRLAMSPQVWWKLIAAYCWVY